MEWLKAREPAASQLDLLIDRARTEGLLLLLGTINLGEVYYNSLTVWGEIRADEILTDFRALPILIVHPTAEDALEAARLKGRYKVAYGDAFATVLALKNNAAVISGDPDFLKLRDMGVVEVVWIGK